MRNLVIIILVLFSVSCMTNYPLTTFYVKNTTDKTLNFKASIIKQSQMGPYEMTLPFMVFPNDSVVARRTNFKKDASPTAWFKKFIIFQTDSLSFNDPKNKDNWIKTTDEKGRPVYTFTMTK
ncbi:MAG TPA: hypothetical protein PLU85_00305 [Bacteroidia bacterium]|nr:hypothetical protein [Bacteroidia bacterium]MBP7714588.1 hypothetical protein [Bacteroidia bacterium]MBP8667885.1 hypothetical protein [Bacteroidia bacterium]HOZ81391.1 hypothetical protein [Bacteroidia bacterium]HQW16933.1 hypothetical protein [Bacteroidia bacterium]